jgi:DNA-binding NarL/FixJ family response regulator
MSAGALHTHIRNIYEKLHVHSRTEAVVKYLNAWPFNAGSGAPR